jgi:ubiquitin carboxyl-terminal hydrolase L5
MDHLNADLYLENEASDAMSKKAKKRATLKKGKKTAPRKRRVKPEYGYHFIAYVPAGGHVWELDGLKSKPRRLGKYQPYYIPKSGWDLFLTFSLDAVSSDHWTSVAAPQIEGRMLQYEESQLSFNLLALCQSPLATHSRAIAQAVASLSHLHSQMKECTDFSSLVAAEPKPLDMDDESQLSEFNLKRADIENAEIPQTIREKTSGPTLTTSEAYALHQELVIEVKASMGEYRAELMGIADDEQRVKGRKKDYGPALHKWVTKLAEKGVLEDMIKAAK